MNKKKRNVLDELSYYILIVLLAIFVTGIAYLMMPILLIAGTYIGYALLLIIGLIFGTFVAFFIDDMDHLTHHHHAGVWMIVILGSVLSFIAIWINTPLAPRRVPDTMFGPVPNALIAGLIFSISFLIPYFIYLWKKK